MQKLCFIQESCITSSNTWFPILLTWCHYFVLALANSDWFLFLPIFRRSTATYVPTLLRSLPSTTRSLTSGSRFTILSTVSQSRCSFPFESECLFILLVIVMGQMVDLLSSLHYSFLCTMYCQCLVGRQKKAFEWWCLGRRGHLGW